jgi:hypothetical protein
MAVGYVTFFRGDLGTARTYLEHSLHLCETQLPTPLLVSGGHDARVSTLIRLAHRPSGRWALRTEPSSGVRKRWRGLSRWDTLPV